MKMEFKYNRISQIYKVNFHCSEPESCNCNEKIIELFNKNSKYVMNNLVVVGLAHIQYKKIKDKIKHKIRVKKLYIWPSEMYNEQEILDLNVLDLLFYKDKIKVLSIRYNQKLDFGDVSLKKLEKLSITVYDGKIIPLSYILPCIIKFCPNVKKLRIEREVESLDFIIKHLIKLNKNLVIGLYYINEHDFEKDDDKYITENNLEKLDEETVVYKLPNIDEDICVEIGEISYDVNNSYSGKC